LIKEGNQMKFELHTPETAPEKSKPVLKSLQQAYGFIPNLAAVFAQSPGTANYLSAAMGAFDSADMELSQIERQVVLIAVSVTNKCRYCTAAHSMLASKLGMDRLDIDALQDGQPMADAKLDALRRFTEHMVEAEGFAEQKALDEFESAGYGSGHVMEVIAGISLKTLTNYTNHVARAPVNDQFSDFIPKWDA
jgi:uncharacterized peroxidase-related enzyme